MDELSARKHLASITKMLAAEKRSDLERLKANHSDIDRPDFLWHYLLRSFSTMGRSSGWHGLIGNKTNYNRVKYDALASLAPEARKVEVLAVCSEAKIRMPTIKAEYILTCFDYVTKLGGQEIAKNMLLAQRGRDAKIKFLRTFRGIGPKYARNIMMDVYHEDFRNSIALDVRIKAITASLGLSFDSSSKEESFYLDVASDAGLNGWELDRLPYNYRREVEALI